MVINYEERAADRPELFEKNSLSWPSEGIVLNRGHVRSMPLMKVMPEVRGSSVVVDVELPDTLAGRSTAIEVRDGVCSIRSLSSSKRRSRFFRTVSVGSSRRHLREWVS